MFLISLLITLIFFLKNIRVIIRPHIMCGWINTIYMLRKGAEELYLMKGTGAK